MDNFTQAILGASSGELVSGKRLGNRALVWGAFFCDFGDLDVLGNLFMNSMDSLIFHRSMTHSFSFTVVTSILFAYGLHAFYQKGWNQRKGVRYLKLVFSVFFLSCLLGVGGIIAFVFFIPIVFYGYLVAALGFVIYMIRLWLRKGIMYARPYEGRVKDWFILSLVCMSAHILLDGMTSFGTQFYWPFANTRVSWDAIGVMDIGYTVPFGLIVAVMVFLAPNTIMRKRLNGFAVVCSLFILSLAFYNRYQAKTKFIQELHLQGISWKSLSVTPTIFQNALWQCAAQSDSITFYGMWSLFDPDTHKIAFTPIRNNFHLLKDHSTDKDVKTLQWFTQGVYAVKEENSELLLSDLRYGFVGFTPDSPAVFRFKLLDKGGVLVAEEDEIGRRGNIGLRTRLLFRRAFGEVNIHE